MRSLLGSFLSAALIAGAIVLSTPAFAQTAEDLRRDGAACELPDGYMRALNPSAQATVDMINAQRRDFYAMRAAEENVDVAAVGAVFAVEISRQPNYRPC